MDKIVTEADLPHSVCYCGNILEDPQAWKNDIFYKDELHHRQTKRALVRNPIFIEGVGFRLQRSTQLGENGYEISKNTAIPKSSASKWKKTNSSSLIRDS